MGDTGRLGASQLALALSRYRDALAMHQGAINRLNVFPVPDGDTGTNMLLTLEAVVAELAAGAPQADMGAVCRAIAKGSLMGARGNSGVILCQVLRALTGEFAAEDEIDGALFSAGLDGAATAARAAVSRPVEGTILTVLDGAARSAAKAAAGDEDLAAVLLESRAGAIRALEETPRLLEVLREAGVVDAGGAGLVLLFDALLSVVAGRALPEVLELPEAVAATIASGANAAVVPPPVAAAERAGPERYEVMCLLAAPEGAIGPLRDRFAELGGSIVIVGGDGLYNCHIHTDAIGAVIEAAIEAGRPSDIRVSDLFEQVEEQRWVNEAVARSDAPADAAAPVTSAIAVATGEGIERIFASLGAERLVAGGQSMNPSTAEILDAVEATHGAEVVILANNGNIVPVAQQVAKIAAKPVAVVPTPGVQEGFAALLVYDPGAGCEENARAMGEAAGHVVAGEVTQAVRDAATPAGKVTAGDWIGLSRAGIETVAASLSGAAIALLEALIGAESEIVTFIEGADVPSGELAAVAEWVRTERPGITVERHYGGQPLYPLLVSIE